MRAGCVYCVTAAGEKPILYTSLLWARRKVEVLNLAGRQADLEKITGEWEPVNVVF